MIRVKRCVSCVVLGITLLVEVILASTSLAMSIYNTQNEMVQASELHALMKNVSAVFRQQAKIDDEFYKALYSLQKATEVIGEEVAMIQLQQKLQCDYRYNTFCLTKKKYESQLRWEEIRTQLHGLVADNITLEVQQLIN